MKWSKVESALRERFADSVRKRVRVHQTRYGPGTSYMMRRAWLTWDGIEIVNFSTATWAIQYYSLAQQIREVNKTTDFRDPDQSEQYHDASKQADHILEKREIHSQYQFEEAIESFLPLSIDDALTSDNPLIRGLAMLDRRLGKRRLRTLQTESEHSFVQLLYQLRCEAESIQQAQM
jgi:hypothetical protein